MPDARDAGADPRHRARVPSSRGDAAMRALLAPIFRQIADWDEVAARVARGGSLADALDTLRRAA
jgi:hypothetical protein